MKRYLTILALMLALTAAAKPIDEAKALYDKGMYSLAIEKLNAIVKGAPRDIVANYYLGMSHLNLGHISKAKAALLKAEDRGSASAAKALAELCLGQYDMDGASEHVDTWEQLLRKAKKSVPDELGEMRGKVISARNMLERVEQIVIIDSINVSKADFFKSYKLSKGTGKLLDGSVLPPQYAAEEPSVVFEPESNKEVFWSMPNADSGALEIMHANILDDGTFENPTIFSEEISDMGDADYLFLASDGMTFYFAANGPESLGGYDIFMSRRDADGTVLRPQNVGMPYNSPYDDYMLVIDDAAGLGWWATDRNQIEDMVTIYTFIPNDTRRNYDPSNPNLAGYAKVTSIADTQEDGRDYSAMIASNPALKEDSDKKDDEKQFELALPGGKVYTSLRDFRNPNARKAMSQYLDRSKDLAMMQAQLDVLRRRYASGDHSTRDDILSLEKRVESARVVLVKMRNDAIRNEK